MDLWGSKWLGLQQMPRQAAALSKTRVQAKKKHVKTSDHKILLQPRDNYKSMQDIVRCTIVSLCLGHSWADRIRCGWTDHKAKVFVRVVAGSSDVAGSVELSSLCKL